MPRAAIIGFTTAMCLSVPIGISDAQIAPMLIRKAPPQHIVHYAFSMSHPPLLSAYKGAIYDVPADELTSVAGTAEYDVHTTSPTGSGTYLNTDKHVRLVHQYYWTLSDIPVRYANEITYKVKHTDGYTLTDKETTEKTLGASAGAKIFGISVKVQASLKITDSETKEWRTETVTEADQTFKAHTIYCTWTLVDDLETTVTTKQSTDASDQPASGQATVAEASFRNAALVFQDDTPDLGAAILANAVHSYGTAGKTVLGAPTQR